MWNFFSSDNSRPQSVEMLKRRRRAFSEASLEKKNIIKPKASPWFAGSSFLLRLCLCLLLLLLLCLVHLLIFLLLLIAAFFQASREFLRALLIPWPIGMLVGKRSNSLSSKLTIQATTVSRVMNHKSEEVVEMKKKCSK